MKDACLSGEFLGCGEEVLAGLDPGRGTDDFVEGFEKFDPDDRVGSPTG